MLSHRSSDKMIRNEHHHGADDGNEHAVQVETGHTSMADELKQPTANERPNHPKHNVEEDTRALARARWQVTGKLVYAVGVLADFRGVAGVPRSRSVDFLPASISLSSPSLG